MKPLHILSLTLILIVFGCHRNEDLNGKSNEEKLNILDYKISRDKGDAKLYSQRAEVFWEMGRVNDAINDLNRAIQLDKDNATYHHRLGDAYIRTGNSAKSYEALQRAEELDPKNLNIKLKLGEVTYHSHDLDRSLEHLTQVTAVDPNNRTALTIKSFIYKEKGDTAAAITLLQKICSLYPDHPTAFEELGNIYATHQSALAEEYLLTALRLDNDNNNIRYSLARYYQEVGKMDLAEEYYKQIIDSGSNDADAWHNRAYIQLFHYGDYELAADYFTQALTCDSTHVASLVNRGIAYELLDQRQKAREDYLHALRIDAQFAPAIEGEKRTRQATHHHRQKAT